MCPRLHWCLTRILGLLLVVSVCDAKYINSFAGPYIAYVKMLYPCEAGPSRTWGINIRVTHFNPVRPRELQRVTGNLSITNETAGLDDNYWMHIVMDLRNNNQWKLNAFVFHFREKACTMWRTHIPDVTRVLFEPYGEPVPGKDCLIPAGTYTFVNKPIRWVYPYFPIMPYGEYRWRLMVGPQPGREAKSCYGVEAVIMPQV